MKDLLLIGNLTDDCVIKDWNGQRFFSFSVAENQIYTDKDGNKVEKATYISCLKPIFGDKDGLGAYLKKGAQVFIRGDVSCKIFERNNGTKDCSLNCKVDFLKLLSSARKQENAISEPQNDNAGSLSNQQANVQQNGNLAPNQASQKPKYPDNPSAPSNGEVKMPEGNSDDLPF